MTESHVMSALLRKRSDLAAKIEQLQAELKRTVVQLDHVEATMRVFEPDMDIPAVMPRRVPTAHHAFRGEMSRIILETLRATTRPMDTAKLSEIVIQERGLDPHDKALLRTMRKRVGACCKHWKSKGVLQSMKQEHGPNLWNVAE